MKLPKARIVLLDDPVPYSDRLKERKDGGGPTRRGRGVAQIYNDGVMTVEAMIELGPLLRRITTPDAYIFCWMTRPNMPMALRIMEGRKLRYCQMPFTWRKLNKNGTEFFGPGAYGATNSENIILGDWDADPDEDYCDVALGRWKGEKLWHPNTGWKPREFISVPHPRYPIDSLRDEDWRPYPGTPKEHDFFAGIDGDSSCVCRICVRGKIVPSRKPEEFQDLLDQWLDAHLGGHTKVEVFATRQRESRGSRYPWICLGGDVTGRDIREDLELLAQHMEG